MTLDILHFQVRTGGVWWEQSAAISLLLFMLLVVQEHFKHILAMDQLVF